MGTERLFLAVRPNTAALTLLRTQLETLKLAPLNARWSPPENLHMTLHFMGNLAIGARRELSQRLSELNHLEGGTQRLDSWVAFPQPGRARVLALGRKPAEPWLLRMHRESERILRAMNIETERRELYPHITFARLAGVGALPALPPPIPVHLSVESVCLFRSEPTPRGSRYEILGDFPLLRNVPHVTPSGQ